MNSETDPSMLPVWRCSHSDICGEQWAALEPGETCPFCHLGPVQSAGFTYGEAVAAAEHFGFDREVPVHLVYPVPTLVQLTSLPVETWMGLPVFHPMAQEGINADWRTYDIGVIVEVSKDIDYGEGEYCCRFLYSIGGSSGTLIYSAWNLWVPEQLANSLLSGKTDTEKQR